MATVKKSKKKVIIPICIVLVIAILAGAIFAFAGSGDVVQVKKLHTITTGDIYETVSLTGDVTSGAVKEYKAGTVATVKEVFVKVGDTVKKGDVLATFDVSNLDGEISSLQSSYSAALKEYNSAEKSHNTAKNNAKQLKKEIASLEKKIAKLEKTTTTKKTTIKKTTAKNSTTAKKTTAKTTTQVASSTVKPSESTEKPTQPSLPSVSNDNSTLPSVTIPTTSAGSNLGGLAEELENLNKTLAQITNDLSTLTKTTEIIADTISKALGNGETDSNAIAKQVGDALSEAMKEGVIDAANLLIESDMAVKMVEAAVASIDFQAITDTALNSKNVTLTSAEIQLAAKYAQYAVFSVQSNDTVLSTQKTAVDASKKALDILTKQKADLEAGWTAAFDGTITKVDVTPETQATMLQSGITLENLDTMIAEVSLSEHDVHKVKVGMSVDIKTAYGEYDGEVVSVAPTATGGSEGSILDSVGSMAGISGLSSLTSSGAGVKCQIEIKDTDENIIPGFTASVQIKTGEYIGVTVVPIESIKLEKTGSYVYLYNDEESTVTKTQIEIGATSDTSYQVISGLKIGDKIISAPESTYEDDTFKVKVAADK
ncbi:MAG: biotin/lipoyl-binding protein [Acetobacter sp.]|nr:biotin/lipoyl-binding protein [Bacteroides sp.]MCM1340287.1 biotin/lipoyl-binding protein [Acetobacter sp.]MCM1432763.1 biotin/lipoyl-binding protein [Clostridiales bacterium]